MAGIERYSELYAFPASMQIKWLFNFAEWHFYRYNYYGDEDDDLLENDEHQQRVPVYPQISTPSGQPSYQYYNSAKDCKLQDFQKHKNIQSFKYESPDEEVSLKKYLGVSVGLISLITENLLSHPFVVLRRQCQVHQNSQRSVFRFL